MKLIISESSGRMEVSLAVPSIEVLMISITFSIASISVDRYHCGGDALANKMVLELEPIFCVTPVA